MLKDEDMNAQNGENKNTVEKPDEDIESEKCCSTDKKVDLDEKSQESDSKNVHEKEKKDEEEKSECKSETKESKSQEKETEEKKLDEIQEKRKKLQKELKKENFRLKDENSKIMNKFNAIQDRLSRTTAEYDNFRKRTSKEKEGIYSDACKDILKEILPVLDNLERAVKVEGNAEDLKKGVEMTMRQFNAALKKLDVEEIPTEGEFDPNIHNAVMHVEDDKCDKNSIVEVFQKGYKRGDKIIRYSMVKVAN